MKRELFDLKFDLKVAMLDLFFNKFLTSIKARIFSLIVIFIRDFSTSFIMKISLVLLIGVIAFARAASGRYDKGTDGTNDFSATHPSVLESSSVAGIRDNKQGHPQHSLVTGSPAPHDFQRDPNLFLSQSIGTPSSTTSPSKSSVKGHFNEITSQHPQAFFNDKQNSPKQQQFFDGRQQSSGQMPFSYASNQQAVDEQRSYNPEQQFSNQEHFLNDRQQQQQFYNDQQQQQQFYDNQQQFFDEKQQNSAQQQFYNEQQSPIQQQFYNDKQQSLNQQQFYDDKQQALAQQQPRDQIEMFNTQTVGITNQQLNNKRLVQDVTIQKGSVKGVEPSIQIHSVSKGAVQLSAFDNRAQPIVLPQSAAMHSSSVLVSGLQNMPLLPAMVYNGGAVPMTHAAVYSRDPLYKGGAAIRQHLQTPFVRYVYSHVL